MDSRAVCVFTFAVQGDIGVGGREIGYMYGMYKRLTVGAAVVVVV